jgi:dGTPase
MLELAPYATHAAKSRGRRLPEPPPASRSEFQRDRDRIMHSGAFRKLQYKTQVFVNHEGDYYRTRLTHSLEVAQIARSVARSLSLDEDLAETVALSHDLGHTCFGHTGEYALDAVMKPWGGFYHNDQTIRILTHLERGYAAFDGLNLTWEAMEGAVKHNGPVIGEKVTETVRELDASWGLDLTNYAGLEAQVAAIADDTAYTAHDIDDGLRGKFFTLDDLAELPLLDRIIREVREEYPHTEKSRQQSEVKRALIGVLVGDVLAETRRRLAEVKPERVEDVRRAGRQLVGFSEGLAQAERKIRAFLFQRLYHSYRLVRMRSKATRVVTELFQNFMATPEALPPDWQAMLPLGSSDAARARIVADYIAGMTDRYAIQEHQRLFNMEVPA